MIGNVIKPLAKSVLIPLGSTAEASATDAAIHKKMFGSGTHPLDPVEQTILITSNEEINIMKIIKSHEESGLLIKGVSKTVKNEAKEQKVFLGMLLDTSGTNILENLLAVEDTTRAGQES